MKPEEMKRVNGQHFNTTAVAIRRVLKIEPVTFLKWKMDFIFFSEKSSYLSKPGSIQEESYHQLYYHQTSHAYSVSLYYKLV